MFRRKYPLPVHRRVKELVWPSQGFKRSTLYIAHRLGRLPGTPYRVAAGFACGAAVSFTPFLGLHFVFAALIALLMRGNLIASAIGTAVGNPWTFPFIWAWIYTVGVWLLGDDHAADLPQDFSSHYIVENPFSVLLPMTVGGIPTAIAAWFVFYWPARITVSQYQATRRKRIRRKLIKRRKSTAGAKITSPGGISSGPKSL